MPDCYDCDGTGDVWVDDGDGEDYPEPCLTCGGSGWIDDEDDEE